MIQFADRVDAGRQLAARLEHLRAESPMVVGIPRGGVPVAAEVARALEAPLDLIIVRKLGVPHQVEVAIGAIGEEGVRVLDREVIEAAHVTPEEILAIERFGAVEVERAARRFRGRGSPRTLVGRTVVVVDDGLASGSSAAAACRIVRARGAARVVLAVPVAPQGWERDAASVADELVTLSTPDPFQAVGRHYIDFRQVSDDQVIDCLRRAVDRTRQEERGSTLPFPGDEVAIGESDRPVLARLSIPHDPIGLVVIANGSANSRHSPRTRSLSVAMNQAGFATLVVDLCRPEEELGARHVYDAELLAGRLEDTRRWIRGHPVIGNLSLVCVGIGAGASAVVIAAADHHSAVDAVVSLDGRPDFVLEHVARVQVPTLLIVGSADPVLVGANEEADQRLTCEHRLMVVPTTAGLLQQPGALTISAHATIEWSVEHLLRAAS